MPEVHIIRVQTVPDPDPARANMPATWITYQLLPNDVIRSTVVSKLNPTEQEVLAAIRDHERMQDALAGKRFTL